MNITLCVLAGVWNSYNEDEDNIFFRNFGGYDKSHSVGLSVVYVLYRRELNSKILCG